MNLTYTNPLNYRRSRSDLRRWPLSPEDRFWASVDKESSDKGCWLWTGEVASGGYGRFNIRGGRQLAHRLSWIVSNGPIDGDLCVLHRCDVRHCVNPSHLFLGTIKDNTQDMLRKGRGNKTQGARVWSARVSDDDVRAIRASRTSHRWIARAYGISEFTVSKIRQRKSWRHIQ